jgi:hypothetical protein
MELEVANQDKLLLFKEGIFWRMYEMSAFRFVTVIKPLKITKKTIKSLGTEMVSCGFPQNILSELLDRFDEGRIDTQEKMIVVKGFMPVSTASLTDWKNSIPLKEKTIAVSSKEGKLMSSPKKEVIDKLRGFPLAIKTPIECQQFIHALQAELHGTV